MKIQVNTGCTSDSIIVDSKLLDESNQEQVIDYLLPKIKEAILNNHISIRHVIELFEYEDEKAHGYCEQCGDTPYSTFYNI